MNTDKLRVRFEDYCNKYAAISMRREDGILEITLGTDGGRTPNWKRLFLI